MTSIFAPTDLLRGEVVVLPKSGDPRVRGGTHWHVDLSCALGLPVHPFLVWPSVRNREPREVTVGWDRKGKRVVLPATLDDGDVLSVWVPALPGPGLACWAEVVAPDARIRVDAVDAVAAPNGARRVLAVRSAEPYHVAGAGLRLLRITGRGRVDKIVVRDADQHDLVPPEGPFDAIGLPDDETANLAWYAPSTGVTAGDWRSRIDQAWPGPTVPVPPSDDPLQARLLQSSEEEVRRIEAAVDVGPRDWLAGAMAIGPTGLESTVVRFPASPRDAGRLRPLDALLTATAADPGLSRWLGLTSVLHPADQPQGAALWLAATIFLVDLDRPALQGSPGARPEDTLGNRLSGLVPADAVTQVLISSFGPRWGEFAVLAEELAKRSGGRWTLQTLIIPCPTVIGAPPDPPTHLHPRVIQPGRWQPHQLVGEELVPVDRWQQAISLENDVPVGPLAFARLNPEGPVSLHRRIPGVAGWADRAAALLAGWPSPASGRAGRPARGSGRLGLPPVIQDRDPIVADHDVAPSVAGGTWRVWSCDWLGRWGPPADVDAPEPQRPDPPPPFLQAWLVAGPIPGGAGSASAGSISCLVDPGSTIAPGGRPAVGIVLAMGDGPERTVPPAPAPLLEFDAPETVPGGHITIQVRAATVDADGRRSAPATVDVDVIDRRPIRPPVVAPRLVMASRRDTRGGSEVALRWPASAGASRYRVFLGSEGLLRTQLGLPAGAPTRAGRAKELFDLGPGLGGRSLFGLLTPVALPVASDGTVEFTTTLPGGQRDLALLRIVPVTGGPVHGVAGEGVEAPFDSCPVVPVAVPLDEAPGPPGLSVRARADGRVAVKVSVLGLDADILRLLDVGPPQARILRRLPGVDDPAFWPEVAILDLVADGEAGWQAKATIGPAGGYPAWTPLGFAAQSRYPAERIAADADLLARTDVHPRWEQPNEITSPWGTRSVATEVMFTPELPTPILTVDDLGDGTRTLRVTGIEPASATAVNPIQVVLYAQQDGRLEAILQADVVADPLEFVSLPPAGGYAVELVDPLGRPGPTVVV